MWNAGLGGWNLTINDSAWAICQSKGSPITAEFRCTITSNAGSVPSSTGPTLNSLPYAAAISYNVGQAIAAATSMYLLGYYH